MNSTQLNWNENYLEQEGEFKCLSKFVYPDFLYERLSWYEFDLYERRRLIIGSHFSERSP